MEARGIVYLVVAIVFLMTIASVIAVSMHEHEQFKVEVKT